MMFVLQGFLLATAVCLSQAGGPSVGAGIQVSTPNNYNYQWLSNFGLSISGLTSITFQVQACNDARVALSEGTASNSNRYEIVIGTRSNSESGLVRRTLHTGILHFTAPGSRLSCSSLRPFWVSWANGRVAVGNGSVVGQNEFMSYQDPTPYNVQYLGVSTGWGATGVWVFQNPTPVCVEGGSTYLPDLNNPHNFYRCQQGDSGTPTRAILMSCPATLVWSQSLLTCVDNTPHCTTPGALRADPADCSFFFQCTSALTETRMACPAGLKFDNNIQACNWASLVNCSPS